MKQYEASARTVEEAIELGLQELGVSIGDVDVRVVEEGSKGLFGLFGSRLAKVCLTVKASEEDPLGNLLEEKKPAKKAAAKKANDITNTLTHILEGLPTDCSVCSLKGICDEVEGMKELHFGVGDKGADKGHGH